MTAQPIDSPAPPPAPNAAAQLRTRIAVSKRADRWLPAFDLQWAQALERAQQSLDLNQVYGLLAALDQPPGDRTVSRRVPRRRLRHQRRRRPRGHRCRTAPVTGEPLPIRLSPKASVYLAALDRTIQEPVLDVLAIAARAPQHWDAWDPEDPDSQDLRAAAAGALTVFYLIQRTEPPHLYVLVILWAG